MINSKMLILCLVLGVIPIQLSSWDAIPTHLYQSKSTS